MTERSITGQPPRLIEIAIEPSFNGDRKRLEDAIRQLALDDPSIGIKIDHKTGMTVLGGANEPTLSARIQSVAARHNLDLRIGMPQVAYLETISHAADVDHTYKKQTGGRGAYARIKIRFEPLSRGCGYQFEDQTCGNSVPSAFIPGVAKGLMAAMECGPLAGFPVTDLKAVLYGGAYHDVDSSALAFDLAARDAVREGLVKAGPLLLEPIMRLEVRAPEDLMGEVIGELNARRGQVTDMQGETTRVIAAMVPLAELFGYPEALRNASGGRAAFTMGFSHYDPVPPFDDPPRFRPAAAMRA
jgi:elongation factor G